MRRSARPHHCHAIDCKLDVPPRLLMCAAHWALVPAELQRRVYAAYTPGQEHLGYVTGAYLEAAAAAVQAVARAEGKMRRAEA
jgi:hypothetical protein